MNTDLHKAGTSDKIAAKKAPETILREEIREGRGVLKRSLGRLFLSGLSGGLDIGFSLFLMAIVKSQLSHLWPRLASELLIAFMYALGFIFVVIGRSELFTEQTTLAVLPVLNRQASIRDLVRVWCVVYVSNLIGAAAFAALAVLIGPALEVIRPQVFGEIAHSLTDHVGWVILVSGLLAGWLMGLLSWLVAASRDTISQVVLTGLIASAIGFAHLHHVVVGTVEVMAGVFAGEVNLGSYAHFLVWTTLGNAVGGSLFVAAIKYGHASGGILHSPRSE